MCTGAVSSDDTAEAQHGRPEGAALRAEPQEERGGLWVLRSLGHEIPGV